MVKKKDMLLLLPAVGGGGGASLGGSGGGGAWVGGGGHLCLLQSSSTLLEPGHLEPPTHFRDFERRPPPQLLLQEPTLQLDHNPEKYIEQHSNLTIILKNI